MFQATTRLMVINCSLGSTQDIDGVQTHRFNVNLAEVDENGERLPTGRHLNLEHLVPAPGTGPVPGSIHDLTISEVV